MADPRSPEEAVGPGAALAEVPLARILGSVVDGLVQAQGQLDQRAARGVEAYLESPAGTLAMPPLWYAFRSVRVDLEMSATVAASGPAGAGAPATGAFLCRLVNPASVSLFGYQASAGLRISLQLGVMGALPAKPATPAGDPPAEVHLPP